MIVKGLNNIETGKEWNNNVDAGKVASSLFDSSIAGVVLAGYENIDNSVYVIINKVLQYNVDEPSVSKTLLYCLLGYSTGVSHFAINNSNSVYHHIQNLYALMTNDRLIDFNISSDNGDLIDINNIDYSSELGSIINGIKAFRNECISSKNKITALNLCQIFNKYTPDVYKIFTNFKAIRDLNTKTAIINLLTLHKIDASLDSSIDKLRRSITKSFIDNPINSLKEDIISKIKDNINISDVNISLKSLNLKTITSVSELFSLDDSIDGSNLKEMYVTEATDDKNINRSIKLFYTLLRIRNGDLFNSIISDEELELSNEYITDYVKNLDAYNAIIAESQFSILIKDIDEFIQAVNQITFSNIVFRHEYTNGFLSEFTIMEYELISKLNKELLDLIHSYSETCASLMVACRDVFAPYISSNITNENSKSFFERLTYEST